MVERKNEIYLTPSPTSPELLLFLPFPLYLIQDFNLKLYVKKIKLKHIFINREEFFDNFFFFSHYIYKLISVKHLSLII